MKILNRRQALSVLGIQAIGVSTYFLTGCSKSKGGGGNITPAVAGPGAGPGPGTQATDSCFLATNTTRGPYFVDNQDDPNITNDAVDPNIPERSDITEDTAGLAGVQPGLALSLQLTINSYKGGTCAPLQNARVDVWHCNALGVYSDVPVGTGGPPADGGPPPGGPPGGGPPPGPPPGGGTPPYGSSPPVTPPGGSPPPPPMDVPDTQGQNFLRGYQFTDANGQVTFNTIYPGWYTGRAVHIHVKVRSYDSSGNVTTEATTQLFFDDTVSTEVFKTADPYNTRSATRDTTNSTDSIYQSINPPLLVNLTGSATTSYSGTASLGIQVGTIYGG